MKILVVMTHYPYPPRTGSAILAYHTIKALSHKHNIHLISADDEKERGDLAEYVEKIEFIGRKKQPIILKLLKYAFYSLRGFPTWLISSMSTEMERRTAELVAGEHYDAILLYEITAIQYCPESCYEKMVVNVEDPPSIKLSRLRKMGIWPFRKRVGLAILEKMTARYERDVFPQLASVLVLSEADSMDMRNLLGCNNIGYIPYGIDAMPTERIVPHEQRTEDMIVFSGNMHHPPNVDGALFLLRHILLLVLKECPNAKLWIVGASPDRTIFEEAQGFGDHVVITGQVAEISEYLRRATVSVCPVKLKVGVQTKVLEALSCGTPVVTTSAGNSGICGSTGLDLWAEDEPEKFAQRVVSLLRGENWTQLSKNGRELAANRFSWARSAALLENHLEEIAN